MMGPMNGSSKRVQRLRPTHDDDFFSSPSIHPLAASPGGGGVLSEVETAEMLADIDAGRGRR